MAGPPHILLKNHYLSLFIKVKSLKRGKEIYRGKSGFALNRGTVNRFFTVLINEKWMRLRKKGPMEDSGQNFESIR